MSASHPLLRYLKKKDLSLREFAASSGVNLTVLSLVTAGKRERFSARAALAIDLATGGAVPFEKLTGLKLPRRKRAA